MCITCCVSQKWNEQYHAASTALEEREKKLDLAAEQIEKVSAIHCSTPHHTPPPLTLPLTSSHISPLGSPSFGSYSH